MPFPHHSSRKIVLCIDDNQQGLAIRKLLLQFLGYEVLLAHRGTEGLQLLRENPVNAVVVDFNMPDMRGDQLATHIRQLFPSLPIVMLSGYLSELPPACVGIVDRFVRKGESATALIDTLREVIRAGRQTSKPA